MSTAMIPVAIKRAERRLIQRLQDNGAISYVTAQPLSGLPLLESQRLKKLLAAGAIQRTPAGHYFLDEEALNLYREQRRNKIWLVVGGAIAAAAAIIGLTRK